MYVTVAAIADERSILVDETQSTAASKLILTQRRPRIRLGIPAMSDVAIRPMIPNRGISIRLMGNPMAEVNKVRVRLTWVFPWLFIRLPTLRFPKAE